VYGSNVIPPKKPVSFWRLCWEALQDTLLLVLLGCSIISLILWGVTLLTADEDADEHNEEWIDSIAIMGSVVVVVLVSAGNDYMKERQFRGLQKKIASDHFFAVLRGGQIVQIPVADIVVGDICQIKYGDLVPADGVLINSNDLKIDESSLTGESDHVKKNENTDPMILSGTLLLFLPIR
jgi:Ca2+ transporting ATPase